MDDARPKTRPSDGAVGPMVDLVIENATVITLDAISSRTDAVAIRGDRIVAVGDEATALAAKERIDVGGRCVVPGFNDAHNHMQSFGRSLTEVDVSPAAVATVAQLVEAIGKRAATAPPGVWVVASGYDDNKLAERRHPTRFDLDPVTPDNPVLITHTSGHFSVVNTVAAELAAIGEAEVPAGGVVTTDDDGRMIGLLEEQAQNLVKRLRHPRPIDDLAEAIGAASDHYLTEGITSCQEAGVGGILGTLEPLEVAAYQQARRNGRLRVRVTLMPAIESLHPIDHHADDPEPYALDLGVHSGFGDHWLRFGATKIFADGSLIGRTAAMFDDFEGEPGNRGYFQMVEEQLHSLILRAHRSGWQVATHAIGDRAVASVIDAYEIALQRHPRADCRHRIEHCGVSRSSDVDRIAKLGLVPVPQGRFISELGDGMRRALGEERVEGCYRQRSFLAKGIVLPGSSDRPVVAGAPLLGIHDMVNQRTMSGDPFNADEAITADEALRAYTLGSAYAAFDEGDKGSIEAGKLADLVVLDNDITSIDPAGIAETSVEATIVGGVLAYERSAQEVRR